MNDFYAILSVPRRTKPRDIKTRFRELAKQRHPDLFQGEEKLKAELEFQSITEAFNVLMNPMLRRQHDVELDRPTKAAKHDPGKVAQVYLNRGIRAYKAGNFPSAADSFTRAVQEEPANFQAWHHLALTCSREEHWLDKAQEAILEAIELKPDHVTYLKLAGKIFAKSKMTARAKQYYTEAVKLGGGDPKTLEALEALGAAPRKAQETAKAGLFRKIW